MKIRSILVLVVGLGLLSGACTVLEKTASHGFTSGYYDLKTPQKTRERVYLLAKEDSLAIYPSQGELPPGTLLSKTSLDLDMTTVLLKLRPARGEVPLQLNSNINAAVYVGYRRDYFKLIRTERPYRKPENEIHHSGFDTGLLLGFGSVPINETVTNGKISLDYDGLAFQAGWGIYLGIENFGFGMGIGFDNLLDRHRKDWIYQRKPWIGFMVGIGIF